MNNSSELASQVQSNPFAMQSAMSGSAMAAVMQNKEAVETLASIWIAKQFPRNVLEVTTRVKEACSRRALAETAKYSYPRGGTQVEGESIQLAQALLSSWGNAEAGWKEVARSRDKVKDCGVSECVAFCYDKETNYRREIAFTVTHWRDTKNGGYALKDERDIYELCANMASRRIRACIFSVLPDWLRVEASEIVEKTLKDNKEPLADRIRKMVSAFEVDFGITLDRIEAALKHKAQSCTETEVIQLGKKYNSLKNGMATEEELFPVTEEEADKPKAKSPAITRKKQAETEKSAEPANEPEKPTEVVTPDVVEASDDDFALEPASDSVAEIQDWLELRGYTSAELSAVIVKIRINSTGVLDERAAKMLLKDLDWVAENIETERKKGGK